MKPGQIAFNIVALLIVGMCILSMLSTIFILLPGMAPEKRGIFHFVIALEAILIVMLGGGAVANFARGRLSPWPTGVIIAGYCISVWLLPLAVWGILALQAEKKRQQPPPI